MTDLQGFAASREHSILEADAEGELVVVRKGNHYQPSQEELEKPYVAPAEPTLLPAGIQYVSNWRTFADGIAKHAREQALALAHVGLPICLLDVGSALQLNSELHPSVMEAAYLQDVTFADTYITIRQFIISTPDILREQICPAGVRSKLPQAVERISKSTIVYTSWERDRVDPEFIEILKTVGQVWVPCRANRDAFVSSGLNENQVKVVPYPYDPKTCTIAAPRGSDKVPSHKRFYNIGKWEPRKNQHQLIGAFLVAFKPTDKASLCIKTSPFGNGWVNYPSPEESVDFWLSQDDVKAQGWNKDTFKRMVRIIDRKVSDEDLLRLHAQNNIYVSAALGEAWDIPAFEAKLAGNALVHVGNGGSEDYAELSSDVRVPFDMGPVHPGYGWEEDAQWARVKFEDFVAALQKAKKKEMRVVPPSYHRQFSRYAVGLQMQAHIDELAKELGCWEKLVDIGGFG